VKHAAIARPKPRDPIARAVRGEHLVAGRDVARRDGRHVRALEPRVRGVRAHGRVALVRGARRRRAGVVAVRGGARVVKIFAKQRRAVVAEVAEVRRVVAARGVADDRAARRELELKVACVSAPQEQRGRRLLRRADVSAELRLKLGPRPPRGEEDGAMRAAEEEDGGSNGEA